MKLRLALLAIFLAFGCCFNLNAAPPPPAKFSVSSSKTDVKSGEVFFLKFDVNVNKTHYTYSTKKYGDDVLAPTSTEITVEPKDLIAIAGKIKSPEPHVKYDKGFEMDVQTYKGKFSFIIPVKAKKDLNTAKDKITAVAYMQFCDSMSCLPADDYKAIVSGNNFDPSKYLSAAELAQYASAQEEAVDEDTAQVQVLPSQIAEVKETKPEQVKTESQSEIDSKKKEGVFSFLWFAMSAGALALLTPCVFPMVPITVSFFTKRAEKEKGKGLRDSIVYALGIITTFTALGMIIAFIFGATGIRDFAANGWINLAIAAIFVVFALNLFGAFEIQIPTGLLNKLNSKSQGSGIVSVLLMGLTFSLTSFTCTVPFVGSALISASSGEWFYPIIGMLGFSTVFAAPFFLLALFPSALKALPKAGGWMNNVKVVMGFLEIAAAIKFISNADLVWAWGVLPKEFFLAIWITCSLLITLYVLGFFSVGYDTPLKNISAMRIIWAITFGTISFYLLTGLFGKPLGELDAFLPPAEYREIMGGTAASVVSLPSNNKPVAEEWLKDYKQGLDEAKKQNKPLFVDFTGFTCTNCRLMEQNMFKKPSVQSRFAGFVKVKLYTDRREEPYLSNKKLQESLYGSIELPLYIVLDPNGNILGTKTFTRDEADFNSFLDKGLNSVK